MMPTRGHDALHRPLLSTVTARVLHGAPCPVWTYAVHQAAPPHLELGIKTVLCAVDLSSRSPLVLEMAARAANMFESAVRLVHVMELSQSPSRKDWTPDKRAEITSIVEGQLRRLAEGSRRAPIVEVLEGSPIKGVIDAAQRCHADLIVVGRTRAVEEKAQRSTSYGILAGSHCPVLSV
jgi:nucleotide-binding universal stress UspA family protein